jgi:chromosome partitioning protein
MSALTHYGVDDLATLLDSMSDLGQSILTGDIVQDIKSINKKELRKFKMKEACLMTDRSDAFLRKLEQSDKSFEPCKINGVRYYTLELINKIRHKAGTNYMRPKGSEPIIMAISNFKGGVGKSITNKSLADKLALDGFKVLSIGLDGQGTDSLYYGIIPDIDILPHDTIRPALLESPSLIKKLIKSTYFDGIDIIPGNLSLSEVEIRLTDYREQIKESKRLGFPDERLSNALNYIKDDYDVILLDCGPNLNMLTLNAIQACNAMLVPVPPASPDVASYFTYCKTLVSHLESTGKLKSLEFFRVLITKHPKNKAAENIAKMMLKEFGAYVMQRQIVYSAEIEKAASQFCSLYELPISSRPTYKRAMESMDTAFSEIIDAIKIIWDAQAQQKLEEAV